MLGPCCAALPTDMELQNTLDETLRWLAEVAVRGFACHPFFRNSTVQCQSVKPLGFVPYLPGFLDLFYQVIQHSYAPDGRALHEGLTVAALIFMYRVLKCMLPVNVVASVIVCCRRAI